VVRARRLAAAGRARRRAGASLVARFREEPREQDRQDDVARGLGVAPGARAESECEELAQRGGVPAQPFVGPET
jgi:hypothetical protein